MSEKKELSLEQVEAFLDSFPGEMSDAIRRKVAKNLGHELPKPPLPELSEQLQEVKLEKGYIGKKTKRNPNPQPKDYITVPSLKFEDDGVKGFWLRTKYARAVANRILEVCDAEGVE